MLALNFGALRYKAALLTVGLLALTVLNCTDAVAQVRKVEPAVKLSAAPAKGNWSMLAAGNLNAKRPKATVNFMGTWLIQRTATNGPPPDWEFFPLPKFTAAAQTIYNEKLQADKDGKAYKDDAGSCYPPGMPRFLTRVWPIQVIQLPTAIVMIQGFENQVRWIYLDGRKHPDPDFTLPSFNGDSIGHFEGKSLVVETRNFEPNHHWIQAGVPVGEQLKIMERWTLESDGSVLAIELTMTDPQYWEGNWVNTKRYNLRDDRDIFEVHCIAAEMAKLPSAQPSQLVK